MALELGTNLNKKVSLKRTLKYLKPYLPRFIFAMVCMSAFAGISVYMLKVLKDMIDGVFMSKDITMLVWVAIAMPLVFGLKGLADYGKSYLLSYIGQNVIRDLRMEMYEKLMSLSHDFYVHNSTAKMMSRVTNDLGGLQGAIVGVPATLIKDGFTFIGMIGVVFYLNWKFAIITFIGFPLAAIPLSMFAKKLRKTSREGQHQMSEIYSSLNQMLNGFSVVKAYNSEKHEHKKFRDDNNKFYHIALRSIRVGARSSPIMEFLGACVAGLVLFFGGKDVISGAWTPGEFMAYLTAIFQMYQPVKSFSGVNGQIQNGIASAERVFEVLDQMPTIADTPNSIELAPFRKSIVYKDVMFGYLADKDVIKDFNININYGDTVAFVGHSGSGKTTIANLLLRFYDPRSGEILFDGQNIKGVTLASLRSQVGIVTQDVMLFDDSVKYNIAYGRRDASMEEIIEAAKNANAHNFISQLPQGYDTLVGERGMKLSGGEKQRISIARAMLKNPPILVLDEATSALDSESEKLVQGAIDNLMKNRTVILIAHRLSTVRNANAIVVMDSGKVLETGTHDELMNKEGGTYRKLINMQSL